MMAIFFHTQLWIQHAATLICPETRTTEIHVHNIIWRRFIDANVVALPGNSPVYLTFHIAHSWSLSTISSADGGVFSTMYIIHRCGHVFDQTIPFWPCRVSR